MTRTYAAKRLLEHGPLTQKEFKEITGWTPKQASKTLARLVELGIVNPHSRHKTRTNALAP